MLGIGERAPTFTLLDQEGVPTSLVDYSGGWVILWWFPKAATPQCTLQGRGFNVVADAMSSSGCTVLAASFDTPEDNRSFAQHNGFRFKLLSDPSHEVGRRYGVERLAGDRYAAFAKREAFLIDPEGIVVRTYDVTDPARHAQRVLDDLTALQGAASADPQPRP